MSANSGQATPQASLPFALDQIIIQSPCTMDWDLMDGDQRSRFCGKCNKHVYDVSEMNRDEATRLIQSKGDSICGRVFRRPDGTVVTADCPRKIAAGWKRPFQFSLGALLVLMTASAGLAASAPWIGKQLEPLIQRFFPSEPDNSNLMTMGDICIPPPPPAPPAPDPNDGME